MKTLYLLLFATIISFSSCNQQPTIQLSYNLEDSALIPKPLEISPSNQAFGLNSKTQISYQESEGLQKQAELLQTALNKAYGLNLQLSDKRASSNSIHLSIGLEDSNSEAYQIEITPSGIALQGASSAAVSRGIQTIRQLVSVNIVEGTEETRAIPTGTISDKPAMDYRGAMLDVSRHFFSVDEVKRYIDQLAYYKINKFHMHLTDDQGWRIEIKSWPKLTTVGGSTEVGGESGGFYTQEEFKELIAYAADRHIEIIPEVDMPGHTNAASVAYPQLNGNGKTPELYEGTKVGFSTFDTRSEQVYEFIDDVVGELAAISPSPYFHLGGDESHSTKKEDFIYFINRVSKIVNKHGKKVIGWDEIAHAEVPKPAVAQYWASNENAALAAEKGLKVLLSPAKKIYLDMQYDSLSPYGLHWAAYVPVKDAYDWDPYSYASIDESAIFGMEAPLWSETIFDSNSLEYLAFPRVLAVAELAWMPKGTTLWDDFKKRLEAQSHYFAREEINYYASPDINWE
jgi:hexosaminidase